MTYQSFYQDTKLGDVLIEKGTEIRLLIHAGHHTEVWNDTWSFNPDRFLKGSPANQNNFFVPFGYGHKICLVSEFLRNFSLSSNCFSFNMCIL